MIADGNDGIGRVGKSPRDDDLVQAVSLLGKPPLRTREYVRRGLRAIVELRNVSLPVHRSVQAVRQRS